MIRLLILSLGVLVVLASEACGQVPNNGFGPAPNNGFMGVNGLPKGTPLPTNAFPFRQPVYPPGLTPGGPMSPSNDFTWMWNYRGPTALFTPNNVQWFNIQGTPYAPYFANYHGAWNYSAPVQVGPMTPNQVWFGRP